MRIDANQTDDASLLAAEVRRLAAALEDATAEVTRLRDEVARLRNGAVDARETVQPTLSDAEREAVLCWCCSGPGIQSFHDSKADAEEYREHSGIADEVEIFAVGRAFTLTDAERQAIKSAMADYEANDMDAGCWQMAATLRGILARLGGDA